MNEVQITRENWREWQGGYIAKECPPPFSNKEELLGRIDQYIKIYEEIMDNDFYNMPYQGLIEGWRGWRFMKQLKDFIKEGNTDEYFDRL